MRCIPLSEGSRLNVLRFECLESKAPEKRGVVSLNVARDQDGSWAHLYRMSRRMPEELERLLGMARNVTMTPEEQEKQQRSFAYGNAHIEKDQITFEGIDEGAEFFS